MFLDSAAAEVSEKEGETGTGLVDRGWERQGVWTTCFESGQRQGPQKKF